jgi:enoyl-CoA hydratase/carnithine racemase
LPETSELPLLLRTFQKMSEHLKFSIADGIAKIVLDRPDRMNAFTFEMIDAWTQALARCRTDDAVKVVIVTGTGAAFCSGGDIVEMGDRLEQTPEQRKSELFQRIERIPLTLEDLDKPVIAVVNGVATGAGMDMALMCDIRYAAQSARFAETYVSVGLVPGAGGAHYLPRLVGVAKALELFFTGEFIDANEALRLGIVNKVFPDATLQQEAENIARKIAGAPPLTIRMIKRAIYQGMRNDLRTNLDLISSHYAIITATQEHKDLVNKFIAARSKRRDT